MKKLGAGEGLWERLPSRMLIPILISLCILPGTAFAQGSPDSTPSKAAFSGEG